MGKSQEKKQLTPDEEVNKILDQTIQELQNLLAYAKAQDNYPEHIESPEILEHMIREMKELKKKAEPKGE